MRVTRNGLALLDLADRGDDFHVGRGCESGALELLALRQIALRSVGSPGGDEERTGRESREIPDGSHDRPPRFSRRRRSAPRSQRSSRLSSLPRCLSGVVVLWWPAVVGRLALTGRAAPTGRLATNRRLALAGCRWRPHRSGWLAWRPRRRTHWPGWTHRRRR